MRTILVSILILLYLVNEKFQTQATEPFAETQSLLCRELSENITVSPESGPFWELNQTNFEIRLSIVFLQNCIYRYVVTGIVIRLQPRQQNRVKLDEYFIKYRLDNTNRLAQLSELATSTTPVNMGMRVEISPLMLEELSISRPPTNTGVFFVRYRIIGFTTPRVMVLSYLIAQPNLVSDDTYTGTCNGEVCYGGRGRLMDTGSSGPQMTVEWICDETTKDCSYPLRILLTGQENVSHIIINGLDTNNNTRSVPEIILIQPNLRTDSISNVFGPDRYPIEIPINRKTDEIFLSMNIPASRILSISEVEIFSNGVNIALFQIEDIESMETATSTSTTTASTSTTTPSISENSKFKVSTITLGAILGTTLMVMVVLTILSIFLFIENRKRLLNTVSKNSNRIPLQLTNHEHSRYSCRLPNPDEIYTTIGPEYSTGNPLDHLNNENHTPDKIIGMSEVRTNPFIETLSENPSGNSYLTETIETTLQTPIESCDSNCQDTDRTPNKELNLEQERRKPGFERDELQNEVYEMRDNPLYPEVEIAHSKDDFPGYDALKH